MRIKMKVTTNGAMYGLQTDIRIFRTGEIYDDLLPGTDATAISPCLVKAFLTAGLAEIVDAEEKMMPAAENKMMPAAENKTDTPTPSIKTRGRKPRRK